MSEQEVEKKVEKEVEPAELNLFFRSTFTSLACFGDALIRNFAVRAILCRR